MKKLITFIAFVLVTYTANAQTKVINATRDINNAKKDKFIGSKSTALVELTPEFINAISKYDYFYAFSDGYAVVQKNDKWGYIDTKGKEVIPTNIEADCVGRFSEGLAIVAPQVYGEQGGFYVIDHSGKTVFRGKRDLFFDACGEGIGVDGIPYFINGLLYVPIIDESANSEQSYKYDVYDKQGNRTGTVDYEIALNYYKNHETGVYTIFSKQHNDRYDDADYENDYRDMTYGLKDLSGNVVLAADYDEINGKTEGTVKVSNGVVFVILHEYDEEQDGPDGRIAFHYGYADLKGNDTFTKAIKDKCRISKEAGKINRDY